MSFSFARHARPTLGTTFGVAAVAAALALHAPPRAAASCDARAVATAPRAATSGAHLRTASDGEVSRDGRCADAPLSPLAFAAAALAMLAVPRARQGCAMEL